MREEEKAYFTEKAEKNMLIPLLGPSVDDEIKADRIDFKQSKNKMIKKEDKQMSERDKLKEKMKRLNPNIRNQLQQQIKVMNKPTTSFRK